MEGPVIAQRTQDVERQRRRLWANSKSSLGQRLVFACLYLAAVDCFVSDK